MVIAHIIAVSTAFILISIIVLTEALNDLEDEDLDNFRNIQICVDVIAMLLVANVNNLDNDNYDEGKIKVMQSIANVLPEFSSYFKVNFLKLIFNSQFLSS